MKKEINALLESENSTLQINNSFILRRWVLHKETSPAGDDYDGLELEMFVPDRPCSVLSKTIKSRSYKAIVAEVSVAMNRMMNEYTKELVKNWKAGYLG